MDPEGRADQWRMRAADGLQMVRGVLDRLALRRIGRSKPPVEPEGMLGGGEQHAAVDQRRHMIEAQAHPLDQRRQVPRVDRLAVDRGLMADRVEAGPPGPGRG